MLCLLLFSVHAWEARAGAMEAQGFAIEDSFDWGQGVPSRGHIRSGSDIRDVRTLTGSGSWQQQGRQNATFAGQPGAGKGHLLLSGRNSLVTVGLPDSKSVEIKVAFRVEELGGGFEIGMQVDEPSRALLMAQRMNFVDDEDILSVSILPAGAVLFTAVIGGKEFRQRGRFPIANGDTGLIVLKIDIQSNTAEVAVQGSARHGAKLKLDWKTAPRKPNWKDFAINQRVDGRYQLHGFSAVSPSSPIN